MPSVGLYGNRGGGPSIQQYQDIYTYYNNLINIPPNSSINMPGIYSEVLRDKPAPGLFPSIPPAGSTNWYVVHSKNILFQFDGVQAIGAAPFTMGIYIFERETLTDPQVLGLAMSVFASPVRINHQIKCRICEIVLWNFDSNVGNNIIGRTKLTSIIDG